MVVWASVIGCLACCTGNGGGVPDAGEDASAADAGGDGADCIDPPPPEIVDCAQAGNCPPIAITGDAPSSDTINFTGFADPTLSPDPQDTQRVWLAYSWPYIAPGRDPDGNQVLMAAVSSHLARSDDGGQTFTFLKELYPAVATTDPEGSGEEGLLSSETVSLATLTSGGATTWYSAHMRYFLRPQTGYNPKWGTSITVRIGAADTPEQLSTADEAVLGVSNTSAAYHPSTRLDQLAGLPIEDCAMLNNPTLFTKDGQLYLIVECLAFDGTEPDFEHTTTQVFATSPSGPPQGWEWRHAGKLWGHSLAVELGDQTVQQPDLSLAADGTLIALVTPAHEDAALDIGTLGSGCAAVELDSIDPPTLRRDCDNKPILRAKLEGEGICACTHHRASATGILAVKKSLTGSPGFMIRLTGLKP